MSKRKIIIMSTIFLMLTVGILAISIPPAEAQPPRFVVSSWDYPDANGQGISTWYLQTNTSGTWTSVASAGYYHEYNPSPVQWNASDPVRVLTWVSMNYTLTGASSLEDGKNYIRQTIVVTDSLDAVQYTEVNGTYNQGLENEGLYWYQYGFVWDFLPLSGEVYTIVITYEVYY